MRLVSRLAARALEEVRRAPSERDGRRALASLAVRAAPPSDLVQSWTGATEVGAVDRHEGEPLGRATRREVVVLGPGVYASVPGREARIALLRAAAAAASEHVVLHVAVIDEESHAGRLVLDAPRRALRAVGVRAPEPGDRFGPGAYAHCFFDEEPLYAELREADLGVAARSGFSFLLTPGGRRGVERAAPFTSELGAALALAREAERARRSLAPEQALAAMRALGRRARTRGPIGRARLRRAVSWVDAAMGASCYRRVLLELALDAGAAREAIVFGLDVGRTGHAAFKGREDRTFDVVFELGPDDPRA